MFSFLDFKYIQLKFEGFFSEKFVEFVPQYLRFEAVFVQN